MSAGNLRLRSIAVKRVVVRSFFARTTTSIQVSECASSARDAQLAAHAVAPKLRDSGKLEAGPQLACYRKVGDLVVREPADGQDLVGGERLDRLVELATEDAMLLVVMQPVAEPYETGNAAAELLDELAPQARLRFLGVPETAPG